jgi:hypothetical protein
MPDFTLPLRYSVLHGKWKWWLRTCRRGGGGMKGLPLVPCVSSKLQEVVCSISSLFILLYVRTILRWKVVLKLELLQNTNTAMVLQLREGSRARSLQIGSFLLRPALLSCVTVSLSSLQTSGVLSLLFVWSLIHALIGYMYTIVAPTNEHMHAKIRLYVQ